MRISVFVAIKPKSEIFDRIEGVTVYVSAFSTCYDMKKILEIKNLRGAMFAELNRVYP